MRRSDREIKDVDTILEIINMCDVCRLGMSVDDQPYIVPLNFGYQYEEETLILYFHCAAEGKKIDMINRNKRVWFEMDTDHELISGDKGCDFTMKYQSVMGEGIIEFVDGMEQKIAGLQYIMKQYTGQTNHSFDNNMINRVTVLKLVVKEFYCKRHN